MLPRLNPLVRAGCVVGCAASLAGAAHAADSVTINLAGVKLQDKNNQSRNSSPNTITPGKRYAYVVDGMVKGDSGVLAVLYPTPTPLATVLETLSPGSSAALRGAVNNLPGTHPVVLVNSFQSGMTDVGSITVTFEATLKVEIDAANIAGFSLTGVKLSPAFLVGSMSFTSGSATIRRVECPTDFNADGFVTADDYDAFVLAFAAGDSSADYNNDGFVTADDFDAFVIAFENGC